MSDLSEQNPGGARLQRVDPQRVEELFAAALELPEGQREVFVAAECQDDQELRTAVSSLLDAHLAPDTDLPELDAGSAVELLDAVHRERGNVGPYRLLEEVGRGGMGAVFRAERTAGGFEQTVALKLVKKGMDSEAILRRFLHERQVLARLEHPHIARLYDGGLSDDGRPYFAMELVDGVPLTEYCDEHEEGIDARLRLFLDVCDAVQHAHANLVIHRDLKPSNILVDRSGQIKLLDFGIARVLQSDTEDGEATLTAVGSWLLTPEYAAPEQVLGGAITTSTDVYSLGVVLYEILTSSRPYRMPPSRSPVALARALEKLEPEPPSRKVPSRRQRPSADLDAIALKALEKDPARRYATVQALAEDVQRSLDGLPVLAHRNTLGYRAVKFLRRHAAAVVTTLAVLAGAIALTTAFTIRVTRERERAEAARDATQEVVYYLVSLFRYADPTVTGGEPMTAGEMLDLGTERLQEDLDDQPEVRARLLQTNGWIYRILGRYDRAEELLRESLALWQTLGEGHELDVAAATRELASAVAALGRYEEAIEMLEQARRIFEERSPQNSYLAYVLQSLGVTHVALGHLEEAEPYLRQALGIMRQREEVFSGLDIGVTQATLADVAGKTGRVSLARELAQEALERIESEGGPSHPRLAGPLLVLGVLHSQAGEQEEALRDLRRALTIAERAYPPGHQTTASIHNNLGIALLELGRLEEAGRHLRLALERIPKGSEGLVLTNLGNIELRLGHLEEAERYYRRALDSQQELPAERPDAGLTLNNLGEVLIALGHDGEALGILVRSREALEAALGKEHVLVSYPVLQLAGIAERQGRLDEAESLYRRAASLRSGESGVSPEDVAEARDAYASFLQRVGRQ